MRHKLLTLFFAISFCFAQAQSGVELKGIVGDSIKRIAERKLKIWTPDIKVIPAIYVIASGEFIECYFGLIAYKSELRRNPPSFYFRLSSGVPAVVYFGLEKNISVNETQLSTLLNLTDQFLEPVDVVFTINYKFWYCKFKGDQIIEFSEELTSKQRVKVPKWVPR